MKPIIQKATIFDDLTGEIDTHIAMYEVLCGNCKESFGLSTGNINDTEHFKQHYHFCNLCGAPVDWSEQTNDICKAFEIAFKAHEYQVDKAGSPYILHPIYVSQHVNSVSAKIVALLHDVIEDSTFTKEHLKQYFTEDIINSLCLLTHNKAEPYFDYIERIKTDPIAVEVKKADLTHNMDLSRIPNPTEKDVKRVIKYKKAFGKLNT